MDGLSTRYRELLSGSYDCVDRIVLNAYFRMGHNPGGFRLWWRALTGSDETLHNAYLMRMAGRFQPSPARLCESPRHPCGPLFGRGTQARYRRGSFEQDQDLKGVVSDSGRTRSGTSVGGQSQPSPRA